MTFRDRMRQLLSVVALFAFVFWLGSAISAITGLMQSRTAEAQTYVRPSKGKPITVFSAVTQPAGTQSSAIYDMTSFSALQVTVRTGSTCTYGAQFFVKGYVDAENLSGYGNYNYDRNAYVDFRNFDPSDQNLSYTYYVNNLPAYVQFYVQWAADTGVATGCTFSANVTPLPYTVPDGPRMNVSQGCTSVTTAATYFGALGTGPWSWLTYDIDIQNVGTVPAICGFGGTTATTGIVLAASTTLRDGLGSSWSVHDVSSPITCLTAASSTTLCYTIR